MLNVVRVEFSKLRRWKLLRVLPLLSLVLPAITFSYFATHPDYLTDMGLYKQALFSFNIFSDSACHPGRFGIYAGI